MRAMPKLYVGLLLPSLAFATISPVIAQAPLGSHPMTLDDVFGVDVATRGSHRMESGCSTPSRQLI